MFGTFLDPKNDFAFKKIFGTEKNKDILIHFLNDVVAFKKGAKIQEVSFLKPILDPDVRAQKTSIVDILCKDEHGNTYIVEMQVANDKGFEKRAQFYASRAYSSQTTAGGEYSDLKEVIFLAILNYVMFPTKPSFKSDHIILDSVTHEHDLKDFSFTFLELPKFNKKIDELTTMTEKWCYFFKNASKTSPEEVLKLKTQDQIIEKAFNVLNTISLSPEERFTYNEAEKHEKIRLGQLAQKFDEGKSAGLAAGLAEGKAEGLAEGLAEGERIGIEKGKAEAAKASSLKIARNLLAQGVNIQCIEAATGLSCEEITALQESLQTV